MYMLVLGHVLALSPPIKSALNTVAVYAVKTPKYAPAVVALIAMLLGWVNWGLGLVAGALVLRWLLIKKLLMLG